jgi:hypothetical protein
MGKKKIKSKIGKAKNTINVTNFTNESVFFFDVTKIYPSINNISPISQLYPTEEELKALEDQILLFTQDIEDRKSESKVIKIFPEFKEHLRKMTKFDSTKTIYAQRIQKIIEEERQKINRTISLSKIQTIYSNQYNVKISLATIHRVLRKHLNLHFKRITIKNSKLNKNHYKFMNYIFLKAILRAIKIGVNIIYIDETTCSLQNNNFKDWYGEKENWNKGPETRIKEKTNIIMAIGINGIIHYKMVESSIDKKKFLEFIEELCNKLTKNEQDNSLIVFDNATCHKAKNIIKIYKKKNLKILTNIPYKSEYNGIEYCFCYFKNIYYKYFLKNKIEQIQKIKEILDSKDLQNNCKSFYLQALEKYKRFFEEEGNKNKMENIFDIINAEKDE